MQVDGGVACLRYPMICITANFSLGNLNVDLICSYCLIYPYSQQEILGKSSREVPKRC